MMLENLKAVTWKKEEESLVYIFQITGKSKVLSHAADEIRGRKSGEGYNPKTKEDILLLERGFESKKEWLSFVNGLTFKLSEISLRTGKERIINEGQKR